MPFSKKKKIRFELNITKYSLVESDDGYMAIYYFNLYTFCINVFPSKKQKDHEQCYRLSKDYRL